MNDYEKGLKMEWYINKGAKACVICEKTFAEEEVYLSALYDENNTFTRKDFCVECWDKKPARTCPNRYRRVGTRPRQNDVGLTKGACTTSSFRRVDGRAGGDDGDIFSYWKTKVPKKTETVQRYAYIDVFYDLFNKLENENEVSRVNFRYVLSLYLMRKKILKLRTTHKSNGNEFLTLHDVKEGKDTEVLKPQLSNEEVLAVTDEIGKLVNYSPQISAIRADQSLQ